MKNTDALLDIDPRGRLTLPKKLRGKYTRFLVKTSKDGTLTLVPQQNVSVDQMELLEALTASMKDFKAKKVKPMPKKWME